MCNCVFFITIINLYFGVFIMEYLSRREFLKGLFALGASFSIFKILDNVNYNNCNYFCLSKSFYLMGTSGKITIYLKDKDYGYLLLDEAVRKVKKLEFMLTKFNPVSELNTINLNPNHYNNISSDFLYLLKLGTYITDNTFGYFDMGMGNLLSYYRIDSSVPLMGNLTKLSDMNSSLLSIKGNSVKLNRNNIMLDLGGIGKGYAIDCVIDFLKENGIKHASFEFGGDIKVAGGLPNGDSWKLYLDPKYSYLFKNMNRVFYIKDGSIAVSGGYIKRASFVNDIVKHHIIDPTMLVSKDYYSISITIGRSAAICDALSTACYNIDSLYFNMIKKNFNNYDIILSE